MERQQIPLMEAQFLLSYKCLLCGEISHFAQEFFDFVVDGQKLYKPKECPSCNSRRGFSLISNDSYVRQKHELTQEELDKIHRKHE